MSMPMLELSNFQRQKLRRCSKGGYCGIRIAKVCSECEVADEVLFLLEHVGKGTDIVC